MLVKSVQANLSSYLHLFLLFILFYFGLFASNFFFAEVEGWMEIDFKLHICAFVHKVMLLNFMSNSPSLKGSKSYKWLQKHRTAHMLWTQGLPFFSSMADFHDFTCFWKSQAASVIFLLTVHFPTHMPSFWSLVKPWLSRVYKIIYIQSYSSLKCQYSADVSHTLRSNK